MTADQIRPNQEISVIKEDETVTLNCSYDTSSSYVYLYWYRKYPNEELRYLLYKAARSSSGGGSPADHRFKSTTSHTSTELTITSVTLSDSALYYCALRVAAQ
uniref:Ig-like domain-containing protein n=1 Tax=Sinocyclocheilus anshuiensis TaxID=1608454 RepID=A0A671SSM6_9TELE